MKVIDFIVTYWDSILVVALLISSGVIMLRKGMKKQVFEILKYLVTQAEEYYGSGTGVLKKQAVIAWIYEKMPSVFRYFLTEETISNLIEKAWEWMVNLIDDNASVAEVLTVAETTEEETTSEEPVVEEAPVAEDDVVEEPAVEESATEEPAVE